MDPADEPVSIYAILAMFASEYLTTALGMPFEVGKTLLQVEYKPKPGVDDGPEVEGVDFEAEGGDETGDEDVEGEDGHGEARRNRRGGHRDSIDAQVSGIARCARHSDGLS